MRVKGRMNPKDVWGSDIIEGTVEWKEMLGARN